MEIVRHTYEKVSLYDSNDTCIGILNNDIELAHVQVQIAKDSLVGYYILWNDVKISLNSNGELEDWPKGMYSHNQELYGKLFLIRQNKRK